jgi:hypothetical protein
MMTRMIAVGVLGLVVLSLVGGCSDREGKKIPTVQDVKPSETPQLPGGLQDLPKNDPAKP